MDFGTINLILWYTLMIYFVIQLYTFVQKLNPYNFFSTKTAESYDTSTKKVKKIYNETIKK
jgi:hypothetical protein